LLKKYTNTYTEWRIDKSFREKCIS
jgi:hypothetical protein